MFENILIFHANAVLFRSCKSDYRGVDLEQLLLYGAYLHTHTWLCMEVYSFTLALSTQHLNNTGFKNIGIAMYVGAWLLKVTHFGIETQAAQHLGTTEVSDYVFSERSQKLVIHEVMLFHALFMGIEFFVRSAKSPQWTMVGEAQTYTWKWMHEMFLYWTADFSMRA